MQIHQLERRRVSRGACLLAWIARWWAEIRRNRPVRRLRIAETLAIGEKRQLLIVDCGERQFLVGAAGNFLTTLAELKTQEISS